MDDLPSGLLPLWFELATEQKAFQVEARDLAHLKAEVAAELARIALGN